MSYYPDSGFTAIGAGLPLRNAPRDWIVWHFTHCANLATIAEAAHLYSSTRREPIVNVARQGVKTRREQIEVRPDDRYPPGKSVADHVPFYLAAKSPMLYAVTQGHLDHGDGSDRLVFLGLPIGNVVDASLVWCASDANAATDFVQFTRTIEQLGNFVDFNLLCQKMWNATPEDKNRPGRRAAWNWRSPGRGGRRTCQHGQLCRRDGQGARPAVQTTVSGELPAYRVACEGGEVRLGRMFVVELEAMAGQDLSSTFRPKTIGNRCRTSVT
jgi:hypothetical protein